MSTERLTLAQATRLAGQLTEGADRKKLLQEIAKAEAGGATSVSTGWLKGSSREQVARVLADHFEPAADTWLDDTFGRLPFRGPPDALAVLSEATRRLGEPQNSKEGSARLYLLASRARMALVTAGIDRRSNATEGFRALKQAVALAPGNHEIADAYGKTIVAFTQLGLVVRMLLESSAGLGIDIEDEARAAFALLEQQPSKAFNLLSMRHLAEYIEDDAATERLDATLAGLPPDEMKAAQAMMSKVLDQAQNTAKD